MKNVRISDDLHQKVKEISIKDGITMDAVFRKVLANVHKVQNANVHDGNTLPELKVHKVQNGVPDGNTLPERKVHNAQNGVPDGNTLPERKVHKVHNGNATFVAVPPKNEKNLIKEKKKMPEITKEDVLQIVANGIRESKTQDQEKADQRKTLEDLKGSVQELKGKFCTPSGDVCFVTQEALTTHLTKQRELISEDIGKKLTEIAKVKATEKPSVPLLRPISKEIRDRLSQEELTKRDLQVEKILNQTNVSPNDTFRLLKQNPEDWESLKRKALEDTPTEKLLNACNLGDPEACKKLFEAQKLVVFKENKAKGKYFPVYDPGKEKSKTGLFGLPIK